MVARPILVFAALLVPTTQAEAGWKLETTTKTASKDISFVGIGCETRSTRTVVLPETATSIEEITPEIGADLFAAGNTAPIATIRALDSNLKQVTWSASGAGTTCAPENDETRWETAIILLKVAYTVKRRVMTRATVIERGDRACSTAIERGAPLNDGEKNAAYFSASSRLLTGLLRELKRLRPPTERKRSFIRFRSELQAGKRALDRAASAARRGDTATAKIEYSGSLTNERRAQAAARAYGFRVCRKI